MTTVTAPVAAPVEVVPQRTPSDILRAAARYIEEHGWCQGTMADSKGRVCMLGAVGAVMGNPYLLELGAEIWGRLFDLTHMPPPHWNDWPGRTEAQVVAMLRKAAAR